MPRGIILHCALVLPLLLLQGCATSLSTSITYARWNDQSAASIESTELKFKLQESTITLALPGAPTGSANPTCPKGVDGASWWRCFDQAIVQAAPAPSNLTGGNIYIAKPGDSSSLDFATTAISGTALVGQDGLYSSITVSYTNNTAAIIAAGATASATAFGIGGPYAAAAGFLLGAAGAVTTFTPRADHPLVAARPRFIGYMCANEPIDVSGAPSTRALKTPALFLPLTILAAEARPFATRSDLNALNVPGPKGTGCWHALPNASLLGLAKPLTLGKAAPEGPRTTLEPGDGWLYRVVAIDPADPSAAPTGSVAANDFFGDYSGRHRDFPLSSCRKMMLQITWWQDIEDAINRAWSQQKPTPRVVAYRVIVADPNFVTRANLKKGGSINFKPDCGANVSISPDTSTGAILGQIVNATETIYSAEQTWKSTQSP